MSVPLQSVPEDQKSDDQPAEDPAITQAKHEAAEIVARARRQAEAIVAEARTAKPEVASPLAALGENAEEIIGQVRKLIKKQRQLQAEREEFVAERDEMAAQIEALVAERDELVQRLTDAVVRMEELATLANQAESGAPAPPPPPATSTPPPQAPPPPPMEQLPPDEDSRLAARLRQAEQAEQATGDGAAAGPENPMPVDDGPDTSLIISADGRSFYSRHSAKLPRLEGDGGRSVLSAVGGMRPETEPKGRKGRRRKKDK